MYSNNIRKDVFTFAESLLGLVQFGYQATEIQKFGFQKQSTIALV